MKYETEEYIINYNECDKLYIEDFINYFEQEKENIFKIFKINKLNNKLIITLYDEIEKYAEYRNNHLSETSVGNTDFNDNSIHMLSYKELIKRKGHNNKTIEDFYKLLIHEFVHVCHNNKTSIIESLLWIREGLAIVLSHQNYDNKELNCSLDDLLNNSQISYTNYYVLMNYAINTYGKEYIFNLIKGNQKEETSKIYNEFMNEKSIRNI